MDFARYSRLENWLLVGLDFAPAGRAGLFSCASRTLIRRRLR